MDWTCVAHGFTPPILKGAVKSVGQRKSAGRRCAAHSLAFSFRVAIAYKPIWGKGHEIRW